MNFFADEALWYVPLLEHADAFISACDFICLD